MLPAAVRSNTLPMPSPSNSTRSSNPACSNVAVTERAWSMATTQGPVPEQSPDQPTKFAPGAGCACSTTFSAGRNDALQAEAGQSMPAGVLVTAPGPLTATSSGFVAMKLAETARGPSMEIVHAPSPLQSPAQLSNANPDAGIAVSVTSVPVGNSAEHVPGQSMPPGMLVTLPPPWIVTSSAGSPGTAVNVATTNRSCSIDTTHGPVPEQSPDQPKNVKPGSGSACRITFSAGRKSAAQDVSGQSMPEGMLVTLPPALTLTFKVFRAW